MAELDLAERAAGFGDAEPITLGRWLPGALVRLVEDGVVTVEQVARAVEQSGAGQTDSEQALPTRLEAVRSGEGFGVLMREVDLAVVVAQMAFDVAKRVVQSMRSRHGRDAAAEELRRELAAEAARR